MSVTGDGHPRQEVRQAGPCLPLAFRPPTIAARDFSEQLVSYVLDRHNNLYKQKKPIIVIYCPASKKLAESEVWGRRDVTFRPEKLPRTGGNVNYPTDKSGGFS